MCGNPDLLCVHDSRMREEQLVFAQAVFYPGYVMEGKLSWWKWAIIWLEIVTMTGLSDGAYYLW